MVRHSVITLLLLSCVIFLFPTRSTAQTYSEQQDNLRLIDRIERLERDLTQLQGQVYRGETPQPGSGSPAGGTAATGNIEVRLSEIEEQMRTLTGRIEKAEFSATKLGERLDKMSADIDFRFGEIEKKGNTHNAEAAPAGGDTSSKPVVLNTKKDKTTHDAADSNAEHRLGSISVRDLKATESKVPAADDTDADDKPEKVTKKAKVTKETSNEAEADSNDDEPEKGGAAKKDYEHAFSLLRHGSYPEAEKAFKKFIAANSKDPLTGSAYYWLGETYSTQKVYDKAAVQYLRGYKKFPDGAKAPDSLLKLGMSLGKLKKKKEACTIFKKMADEYPDISSSLTQRAQEEAKHVGCK